jgi:hypothetical protein
MFTMMNAEIVSYNPLLILLVKMTCSTRPRLDTLDFFIKKWF